MKRLSAKHLRLAAFLLLDRLLPVRPFRKMASRAVLLVRTDAIGDFVLWLDAARQIVRFYKDKGYGVVLLANPLWGDWAREIGDFDEVLSIDRQRFESDLKYRRATARELRLRNFATAINPIHSRDHFSDSLIRLSGAQERIGIRGDSANLPPWQARFTRGWYTRLIPAAPPSRMEMLRNGAFVRQLTGLPYAARVADLDVLKEKPVPSELAKQLKNDSYFVLFPAASRMEKCWPTRNFARVAEALAEKTGWKGIVCGGPGDVALAEALCREAGVPLLNWAGKTALSEMPTVLAGARVLVANDTSAIHIAAAVGTPALCVLGGGQYGRFLPYEVEDRSGHVPPVSIVHPMPCFGCDWRCIFPLAPGQPYPCVERISIDAALLELSRMLDCPELVSETGSAGTKGLALSGKGV